MNKLLCITILLAMGTQLNAQHAPMKLSDIGYHMTLDQKRAHMEPRLTKKQLKESIFEPEETISGSRGTSTDTVGLSTYDLQTNNGMARRIENLGDGRIIAIWTRSMSGTLAAPQRGTGYNIFDGTSWDSYPTVRIENVRTGWPCVGVTGSGREFALSHLFSQSIGLNFCFRNTIGTGSWTSNVIPNDPEASWPRVANKGDTIYVISSRISGNLFNGVDGGLSLFRSFDGGDNWMGPDSIPGVNVQNFAGIGGDGYAIDAKDNTVAFVIGLFEVKLFKSTDAGNTWTKTIVKSVSDRLYTGQVGETLDSVVTTDEAYSILIDHNDVIHIWYGRNVVMDDDAATAGWTYFPYNNGIMYWNDQMTGDPVLINRSRIANDTLVYDDCDPTFLLPDDATQAYFGNIVSMPNSGIDAAGNLYLSYAALRDGALDPNGVNNRATYVLKSMDGGNSWIGPYNIHTDDQAETFYGSMARLVDDSVHMLVQVDNISGTAVQNTIGPSHPFVTNSLIYKAIGRSEIVDPPDITCPTISAPNDTVQAFQNCAFDPGFADKTIVTDDIPQGDVNQNIMYIGTVNTAVLGFNTIEYFVEDDAGNRSDTISRIVEVVADTEAPEIILNGYPSFAIYVGTPYVEAGATVTDNASCDLSADVTITGTVNSAVVSLYTLTYNVSDSSGNAATPVTRDVDVIVTDVDAPVITLIGPDTIIIEVFTSFVDSGATAFDNIELDVTSKMTYSDNVDTAVVGIYMVTYTVSDTSGNSTTKTRVVLVLDLTAPVLTLNLPVVEYEQVLGTTYTEPGTAPGYTAIDNYDGDITGDVVVDMSGLDMNTVSIDTIVYTVTDSSGNTAQEIRTVKVVGAPTACFTCIYPPSGGVLIELDAGCSTNNPDSYDWSFGDGAVKCCSDPNPTHAYAAAGQYTVTLKVSNTAGTDVFTKEVIIFLGIDEVSHSPDVQLMVHPNPSDGQFTLEIYSDFSDDYYLRIFNSLGVLLSDDISFRVKGRHMETLDLSPYPAGVYLLELQGSDRVITKKLFLTE